MVRRGLPWISKPEPLANTTPRHPDATELLIEKLFQKYFRHIVENSQRNVRYFSADGEVEVMMSPSAQLTSDFDDVELRIKILTPTFYSEFIRHPTSLSALITLSESGETITISHPELLTTLDLDSVPHHQKVDFKEGLQWRVLQRLRPFKSVKDDEDVGLNVSSFEKFIITHCEAVERKEYVWRVL